MYIVMIFCIFYDVTGICIRCAEYSSMTCPTALPLASLTECVLLVELRHNPEERLRWDGGNFRTFEVVSAANGPVQQAGQCWRVLDYFNPQGAAPASWCCNSCFG